MSSHPDQAGLRNALLASLPEAAFGRLAPHLERLSLEMGHVVQSPGAPIEHAYFPEPGVISVVARGAGRERIEAGIIGPEGMTGVCVALGVDRTPDETFVQVPCRVLRIAAADLRGALEDSRPLHEHLLRFAYVFSVQLSQTALANGRATIDERLARWLLMCHDRCDREDLPITHETLSLMLGVRRAGVTTALASLAAAGAIGARRGSIRIRDRTVLIEAAGDIYGVAEAEYRRLFETAAS